jgi:hypothetical protein
VTGRQSFLWQWELDLPGYDSYGQGSANPSLLIGADMADLISSFLAAPILSLPRAIGKVIVESNRKRRLPM